MHGFNDDNDFQEINYKMDSVKVNNQPKPTPPTKTTLTNSQRLGHPAINTRQNPARPTAATQSKFAVSNKPGQNKREEAKKEAASRPVNKLNNNHHINDGLGNESVAMRQAARNTRVTATSNAVAVKPVPNQYSNLN